MSWWWVYKHCRYRTTANQTQKLREKSRQANQNCINNLSNLTKSFLLISFPHSDYDEVDTGAVHFSAAHSLLERGLLQLGRRKWRRPADHRRPWSLWHRFGGGGRPAEHHHRCRPRSGRLGGFGDVEGSGGHLAALLRWSADWQTGGAHFGQLCWWVSDWE